MWPLRFAEKIKPRVRDKERDELSFLFLLFTSLFSLSFSFFLIPFFPFQVCMQPRPMGVYSVDDGVDNGSVIPVLCVNKTLLMYEQLPHIRIVARCTPSIQLVIYKYRDTKCACIYIHKCQTLFKEKKKKYLFFFFYKFRNIFE